jgi:hypothetical protein
MNFSAFPVLIEQMCFIRIVDVTDPGSAGAVILRATSDARKACRAT